MYILRKTLQNEYSENNVHVFIGLLLPFIFARQPDHGPFSQGQQLLLRDHQRFDYV